MKIGAKIFAKQDPLGTGWAGVYDRVAEAYRVAVGGAIQNVFGKLGKTGWLSDFSNTRADFSEAFSSVRSNNHARSDRPAALAFASGSAVVDDLKGGFR